MPTLVWCKIKKDHTFFQRKIKLNYENLIFNSSELKTPSFHLSVNFSHFHLLLQNHWVNFNQTWHKASLGEGNSSLFK